jgi:hypothetical protein
MKYCVYIHSKGNDCEGDNDKDNNRDTEEDNGEDKDYKPLLQERIKREYLPISESLATEFNCTY